MSKVYTWVITQLECHSQYEGHTDVVFRVHWRRQVTDGVVKADACGSYNVVWDSDTPFTVYADLTFAQVCNWLETGIGSANLADLDTVLASQVDTLKTPSIVNPELPWVTD